MDDNEREHVRSLLRSKLTEEDLNLFRDNDLDLLARNGFTIASVFAGADENSLKAVLPGRIGLVQVLLKTFAQSQPPVEKLTAFDWLRQDLPLWNSGRFRTTPSATHMEWIYRPVSVAYWDVVGDVEDFMNKANKSKRIYQKVDGSLFTAASKLNSDGIFTVILCNIIAFFNQNVARWLVNMEPGSLQ